MITRFMVYKNRPLTGAVLLTAVFLCPATSQGAEILHAQNFETSTAAVEYASGDFDPVPIAGGTEELIEFGTADTNSPVGQVIKITTTENGAPAGQAQVMNEQSLKMEGNTLGAGIIFKTTLSNTTAEATVQFYIYPVPELTGGANRMFEFWSGLGEGTGADGWAFRVDEDGSLFYDDGATPWVDTGFDLTHHQWNKIRVSSEFTSSSNYTVLTINDTFFDNGGAGFGINDAVKEVSNIDRIQLQASSGAGPNSGVFYDNIWIADTFTTADVVITHTETTVAGLATVDFTGSSGADNVLEAGTDLVTPDWTQQPYSYRPNSPAKAFDQTGSSVEFYRVGESLLYHQGFEGDTAAVEFASGDFNPGPTLRGADQDVTSENSSQVVQVVSTSTTPNGNPSDGVQVIEGSQSLKMDANSGSGPQFRVDTVGGTLQTLRFSVYSDTGSAVGGGRIFEVWNDDLLLSGAVNIFAFRIDENGDLYYDDNGPWSNTSFTVTHNQWNTFLVAVDTSNPSDSNIVHLAVNNVPVMGGANLARNNDTGKLDRIHFQANNTAGSGAGVFYDDIRIYDAFLTSSVAVAINDINIEPDETQALEFDSVQGVDYVLQYTLNTVTPTWVSAPYTIHGTGAKAQAYDPDGYSTTKTYRVVAP